MNPLIGLDMLYIAKLTADTAEAVTYGTPERVLNVTEVGYEFETDAQTYYADNGPAATYVGAGKVNLTIKAADLTPAQFATVTGAGAPDGTNKGVINITSVLNPPDMAVGFRALRSDGTYRYMWIMKGKFNLPKRQHNTKGESVDFQELELEFTGVARIKDKYLYRQVDSDDTNLPELTEAQLAVQWFASPDVVPAVVAG
jgi:phi13 family phage major tail protein